MQVVMAALNAIGRILEGDMLVVDLNAVATTGQIVVCVPGYRLHTYNEAIAEKVMGTVIRFYADPCPHLPTIRPRTFRKCTD
jgi:hypothetical protein